MYANYRYLSDLCTDWCYCMAEPMPRLSHAEVSASFVMKPGEAIDPYTCMLIIDMLLICTDWCYCVAEPMPRLSCAEGSASFVMKPGEAIDPYNTCMLIKGICLICLNRLVLLCG